ncbi:MAG: NAD-dependent DNA ligase LigA [Treponema sp.]|jgi:DNA ligase (NAD+)|nr:NAD-dependent DNA ligase LigA [Treponema sp.]
MAGKEKRVQTLERLIKQYQASYYNGEAEIPDSEFDLLWDELKQLAPESAVLQKVGTGPDTDGFPKAKHIIPMGSQEKASNPGEFLGWARKMGMSEEKSSLIKNNKGLIKPFLVQYKLDGASLELQYEKGKLLKAITRGNGITGDEITANALRMAGVPIKLDVEFSGGIRGEVVMTRYIWKSKYSDKANCRNAANGIMRRKDGDGCQDLNFIVYDASCPQDDNLFKYESDKIEWLQKRGFRTTETKTFLSADEIIAWRDEVAANREKINIDIDGLVVKDNETDMEDLRRARPEKQIAFKFDLESTCSILREVEWSESGATYTPVGVVDPVRLAGTVVKRANLNNPGLIRAMGLKLGSTVKVVKRGEIIPKIEGLAPVEQSLQTGEIPFPKTCSACGAELVDIGTRLYCPNANCPKRLLHRLEKWVSVLDVRELGEKLIRQLFEKKRVTRIPDLYTLNAEELASYERMGALSAAKVVRHIQTKRELSLASFIAGFDFEGIAETTMEKITLAGFNTLERLRDASGGEIASVYGLGDITAAVIADGLKECASEMDAVLKTGVISIAGSPSEESLVLRGLSFCFTGELNTIKRSEAEEKIKALGASAKSSVVKGLSYLVTNDTGSGSAKNKKARELGIAIINEEEFLNLISPNTSSQKTEQGLLFE